GALTLAEGSVPNRPCERDDVHLAGPRSTQGGRRRGCGRAGGVDVVDERDAHRSTVDRGDRGRVPPPFGAPEASLRRPVRPGEDRRRRDVPACRELVGERRRRMVAAEEAALRVGGRRHEECDPWWL